MPVITITGETGSDADRIAYVLADRLGVRVIDRQALIDAARVYDAAGVRRGAPELDERAPSLWERLNEERRRYAVLVRAVVYSFAAQGDCVMLGYGSGILLRDIPHVVKVRTIAPRELRLQRLMTPSPRRPAQPTPEAAEEALRRGDRDRKRFIRYLFNIEWDDPAPYDLVLNTRTLTADAAAELLALLVARPEFQPTPESLARLHDLALASQVEAVLLHDPDVWVENLRVSARGGVITLVGQVLAEEDRDLAESAARRVSGVQVVRNEISVQPPPLAGM
ncbi:MAG: cytidylate kinase family protein [Chloroflexi bacterium]|nr:cytidylate kinase family protein [Chloroflexota bacterium]